MSQTTQQEFGRWRSLLWPVHSFELKKLLPMFFISFLVSFNYTILRDTKDTLLVSGCGAAAIPFVKLWGVLPAAILFMLVYTKLSNVLSREKLFYVILSPFLVFFAAFATIFYPFREAMQPNGMADYLLTVLPSGWGDMVEAVRNWPFVCFYVLSEMWGSVALSLLFWGFANQITKVNEAKRFYSLFGIGMNIALLVSGPLIIHFSKIGDNVPAGTDPWQMSLNYLMTMVVFAGLAIMGIYYWINRNVLTDRRFYDLEQQEQAPKKKKVKMGVMESLKYLASSKYILCLTVLVLCYGVAINLVEVTWKSQLKQQYTTFNEYSHFMGWYSTFMGLVSTLMMLFVGGNVIRRFGWKAAAFFTPIMLLVTGGIFFVMIIFKDSLGGVVASFGTTTLFLAVIVGAIQNILSKATKYSMFDPTKEMAYIPLDPEMKMKGKAAVDVVGARMGKSGGSLIQAALLTLGPLLSITGYIGLILMAIIVVWLIASNALGNQFIALQSQKAAEERLPKPAQEVAGAAQATS